MTPPFSKQIDAADTHYNCITNGLVQQNTKPFTIQPRTYRIDCNEVQTLGQELRPCIHVQLLPTWKHLEDQRCSTRPWKDQRNFRFSYCRVQINNIIDVSKETSGDPISNIVQYSYPSPSTCLYRIFQELHKYLHH